MRPPSEAGFTNVVIISGLWDWPEMLKFILVTLQSGRDRVMAGIAYGSAGHHEAVRLSHYSSSQKRVLFDLAD